MRTLSTTLFSITLLFLPATIAIENQSHSTWNNRLAIPDIVTEPNRHTPKYFAGTFLPPRIINDTTLTADDNPVILASTTEISPQTTLTINPGVFIYTNENANLVVLGQLDINGKQTNPVRFSTNEEHPLNQTWLGISAMPGSVVDVKFTMIENASPAITCMPGSQTTIGDSFISKTIMGIYAADSNCSISNTTLRSMRDGIVSVGSAPALTDNTITARKNNLKKVEYTKY